MKKLVLVFLSFFIFSVNVNSQLWNRLTPDNGAGGQNNFGTFNNFPIRTFTNNVQRMHLNENLPYSAAYLGAGAAYLNWLQTNYPTYGVGTVGNGPNGFLGINTTVPRSRLHIQGDQVQTPSMGTGWRPWMRTGAYMSEESNNMYVGLINPGNGSSVSPDAVVNWGDDLLSPVNRLRINFTSTIGALPSTPPASEREREMMSFWPDRNIGIGDLINFTNGPVSQRTNA